MWVLWLGKGACVCVCDECVGGAFVLRVEHAWDCRVWTSRVCVIGTRFVIRSRRVCLAVWLSLIARSMSSVVKGVVEQVSKEHAIIFVGVSVGNHFGWSWQLGALLWVACYSCPAAVLFGSHIYSSPTKHVFPVHRFGPVQHCVFSQQRFNLCVHSTNAFLTYPAPSADQSSDIKSLSMSTVDLYVHAHGTAVYVSVVCVCACVCIHMWVGLPCMSVCMYMYLCVCA